MIVIGFQAVTSFHQEHCFNPYLGFSVAYGEKRPYSSNLAARSDTFTLIRERPMKKGNGIAAAAFSLASLKPFLFLRCRQLVLSLLVALN